jgi:hypothetical protein
MLKSKSHLDELSLYLSDLIALTNDQLKLGSLNLVRN